MEPDVIPYETLSFFFSDFCSYHFRLCSLLSGATYTDDPSFCSTYGDVNAAYHHA